MILHIYIYNWQQQKYIKFYVLFYFPIQELALISQHLAIINIKLIHWTLSNLFQNALVIMILQGFQWGDMHCAIYMFFSPLPIIKSCSHLNEFKFLSMAKYMSSKGFFFRLSSNVLHASSLPQIILKALLIKIMLKNQQK